jgi:hypothetical protein
MKGEEGIVGVKGEMTGRIKWHEFVSLLGESYL